MLKFAAPKFAALMLQAVLLTSPAVAADMLPLQLRTSQDGISAELRIDAQRSGPVPLDQALQVSIVLKDEASGEPLRGLRPRLWMSRQAPDRQEPCADQVRRFVGGRLSQRADRDLNGFQFLTLNADASVSVINPQIQLNNTKLEALITLPGIGTDWVHSSRHDLLFVTLAERAELAVVDLARHRVAKTLALGQGRPNPLLLSADQSTLWVGIDESDRLVAIDTLSMTVRSELSVGLGPHALALSADGAHLMVSSGSANWLTLVDARRNEVTARLPLPGAPRALAYSALSQRAYISLANSNEVLIVDPANAHITGRLATAARFDTLKVDPSGRYLIGLSSRGNRLVAVDTASVKVIASTELPGTPDQLAFTGRFAYVRSQHSLNVTMLDLDSLGAGKLATNSVPFFQRAPGSAAQHFGPAPVMAASPEGDSIVVGNPADTALYYYTEGMMAPQGSYQTYSRAVRGLMVVDRSLREVAPGEYALAVKLDRGGSYSLPLLLAQPRLIHCFALEVDDPTARQQRRFGIAYRVTGQDPSATLVAGAEQWVRVDLVDADSGSPISGVTDLQLMVLELPGLSQQRQFTVETAPGQYRVKQRFQRAGQWRLSVQSQSQGLRFEQARTLDIHVIDDAAHPQPSPEKP